jgi:hypothetical protein
MDNDIVRQLTWRGLLTALSALATLAATRVAAVIWRRAFNEEPPE